MTILEVAFTVNANVSLPCLFLPLSHFFFIPSPIAHCLSPAFSPFAMSCFAICDVNSTLKTAFKGFGLSRVKNHLEASRWAMNLLSISLGSDPDLTFTSSDSFRSKIVRNNAG